MVRELTRYKLDFVNVLKVRWDSGHCKSRRLYFFYGKGNANH
jgi:hypothetical protein